jgi:hypothetical protein
MDQLDQSNQVRHPKPRPARRQLDHRIGWNYIGPRGGNGDEVALLILVVSPFLTPVQAASNKLILAAKERVERMGDTEKRRLTRRAKGI